MSSRLDQARKALAEGTYVMYKNATYRINSFNGNVIVVGTPDGCAPYSLTVEDFCADPSAKVLDLKVIFGNTSVGATDWSAA